MIVHLEIFLHFPWPIKKFSRWCEKNINWHRDTLWYYCPLGPELQLRISILPDIIFCKSLTAQLSYNSDSYWIFSLLFFVQEDWGEISICGAAEFMNYIVRPMNKQTLMCFNFAGTIINLDRILSGVLALKWGRKKWTLLQYFDTLTLDRAIILKPSSMQLSPGFWRQVKSEPVDHSMLPLWKLAVFSGRVC